MHFICGVFVFLPIFMRVITLHCVKGVFLEGKEQKTDVASFNKFPLFDQDDSLQPPYRKLIKNKQCR